MREKVLCAAAVLLLYAILLHSLQIEIAKCKYNLQGCRDHTTKEQRNVVQYSGNAGIATCSKPLDAPTCAS